MKLNKSDYSYLRELGLNIRSIREKKGWSQETLSFQSGLHRTYIGAIERGERNITILNLRKIAEALEVPISELLPK
ncbi:helix-turn-helix transcriptional regulator [Aneurinibacillus thermoaerophilus]|uniref:helix-turn-helix domain-containing protein n=1 Tax=Aneurinibacillus thermoaerophilus TaxID=143495 RepID=UPI002E20EC5C|nr:helix-turn-helix transcriptional regulator [Aneurinibacillus thermoaerophilus]MED0764081.1 helix-turn-helix transcriptional regulator [Aneurinibacillus thermoaerophilus]